MRIATNPNVWNLLCYLILYNYCPERDQYEVLWSRVQQYWTRGNRVQYCCTLLHKDSNWSNSSVVIVLLHKGLFYYNFTLFENVIILKKKLKILKSYENFESFEILWTFWKFWNFMNILTFFLCTLCCQFIWSVNLFSAHRYSLTFIAYWLIMAWSILIVRSSVILLLPLLAYLYSEYPK